VAAMICLAPVHAEPLSRGHQILQENGLPILAMVVPSSFRGPLDQQRFRQSCFTGLCINSFDRSPDSLSQLGPPLSQPSCLWLNDGSPILHDHEQSDVPRLLSLQWKDEQDIADPNQLAEARATLAQWRDEYPESIGYLNQNGIRHTVAELNRFVSTAKPDMVMFDLYPFDGNLRGGSPTQFYRALQVYRQLALGGHDGSGKTPIPSGLYLQTFASEEFTQGHHPSASEMRLNQFSAWAFGYTYACAFIYGRVEDNRDLVPTMFQGGGDETPRQPAFGDLAETNRQSRNIGPSLVRLRSSSVAMLPGRHQSTGGATTFNEMPLGVLGWTPGFGGDAHLIEIEATNVTSTNHGLPGDVIIGHFVPLDGRTQEVYFMVVNGLTAGDKGVVETSQRIRLVFDFEDAAVRRLLRLSRNTGKVEPVELVSDGGSKYHLDLTLEGGTGDLFKYDTGSQFVGPLQ
jgi:hypothetical protein